MRTRIWRFFAGHRRSDTGLPGVWLSLLLAALAGGCRPQSEVSQGAQLILSTGQVQPGTTFEVRFDRPVARGASIGLETAEPPLVFQPALKGRFVWTSSRSGVFSPTEPLALDTEYRVRLRPGLREADGRKCEAVLRRKLRTPAFGVENCQGPEASTNAFSDPVFRLAFNAEVAAHKVGLRAGFRNDQGQWVPAAARQGTDEDFGYGLVTRTWREIFQAQTAGTPPATSSPGGERAPCPVANLVLVWPVQPLGVGAGWRLVLAPGLPSADGRYHTRQQFEARIGDIAPFEFKSAEMRHVINQRPELEITFSKPLPPALTNTHAQWIHIAPPPEKLEARVTGRSLRLAGDWRRDTTYSVTLLRGFPADEAFQLSEPVALRVEVPPVAPRLYFPAFVTEQYAGGGRSFSLLAVNVPKVRLRAKRLEPETFIHALRGYQAYHSSFTWPEGYRRQNYELVPGRTVFSAELEGANQPDAACEIKLDWDRLLQGRKTGVVFLEAERLSAVWPPEPPLGAQAIIQLTDLGLVWKTGGEEIQVFVFSCQSGRPVQNARVRLCSDENENLREAVTDARGVAVLKSHAQARWVAVQQGEDFHAVGLEQNAVPLWAFEEARWQPGQQSEQRRVAFFSDREVYRPGETVHLKAIVRDLEEAGLRIPAGVTGTLACADSRRQIFFETNILLNDLGACEAAIVLPSGPRGEYLATLRLPGREQFRSFQVADFQTPAFEIELAGRPVWLAGEKPEVAVAARYFFGRPLTRAKVRWWLNASDAGFQPPGFGAFQFVRCWQESRWGRGAGGFAANGEGELRDGSNLVVAAEVPLSREAPQPREATFLVEITDLNQQTLSRLTQFTCHSSEFYLGVRRFDRVLEAGSPLPLEVAAVAGDGSPWTNRVAARLTLYRVKWDSVRMQAAGRTVRYRSEPSLETVEERAVEVAPPFKRDDANAAYEGCPLPGWVAPGAGEYLLEVTAQDGAGNPVACSVAFEVTAPARLAWNYRNEVEIKLAPDKAVYAPGETATVLVKTPISGTAWVTVERDHVRRSFVTQLEGNAPAIRVPLEAADVPNVFVSVTLLRGGDASSRQARAPEYRLGFCQLRVEDPASRLRVELVPSAADYRPGEAASVTARVRDAGGAPVAGAEVVLYAVDEGVLALTDFAAPDLHALLLAPAALEVSSALSLPLLLPEDPEERTFHNKGYLGGGGGKERARRNFPACAFWLGGARTGPDGQATARFTVPDSLTRYRVIAVAHTARSQFGQGTAGFTVSKPLILEPSLPQFGHVGDRLQGRALLLNQTDAAQAVRVSIELDSHARAADPAGATASISVPARGSAVVDLPLILIAPGPASWTWRARVEGAANEFSDTVMSTLQVHSAAPLLREVASLRGGGRTNLLASINPQLLAGSGTVTVHVANTRLVTLGEAVRHLLQYPYGCAEQTASSLLPWVLVHRTPALAAFTGRETGDAAGAVRAGIDRLLAMQTPEGGLAYWPGGREPMLWASAYGALVLGQARKAGVNVPEQEFLGLLNYLRQSLLQGGPHDPGTRLLALCALALGGKPLPALHTRLAETVEKLSSEDRALLALAMAWGESQSAQARALLQARGGQGPSASPFASPVREKAIRLLAWQACAPGSSEAEALYQSLEKDRRSGHWSTTQGDAWTLLALWHYLAADGDGGAVTGSLDWGGDEQRFELPSGHNISTHVFLLSSNRADQPLWLRTAASPPPYIQVRVEARLPGALVARQNHGLGIERKYARLGDDNLPLPFEKARVGDRVLVTLRLSVPEAAEYVAVEDPLPGVLEALNPEFKTQQTAALSRQLPWTDADDADEWWSDFREIRADRVLFFCDRVPAGHYLIRYVARVRAAGTVIAPAAKVEEMYRPERFGLSDTQTVSTSGD